MAKRTRTEAEKTRGELLHHARHLFETEGFKGATVSRIVQSAGITKGALFHHFKTKEDLFQDIWTQLQAEMDAQARANAQASRSRTDPYSAFLAGCRTYVEWTSRRDYQQIVLIDGPSVLKRTGWYEAENDLGRRNVSAGVRYLARKGIVAEHRVRPLTVLVHSALNGAGFAMANGEEGITVDSVLEAFEAVLKSLR
ncbi:MAG: TetR family transcriptional regulator [Pseudomonadota bacterium]